MSREVEAQAESGYHLPFSLQQAPQASSGVKATFDVVMTRTQDLDQGRIVAEGTMVIFGPQGRRYANSELVEWAPNDEEQTKTVLFTAPAPGRIFNLTQIADEDGLVTDPESMPDPWLSLMDLHELSDHRVGMGAELDNLTGAIREDGRADRFLESDVGLYLEITASSSPQNVGR
ncbi:MAG: hypothetical protein ACPG77_09030, partial [Nannocystaceae bacterium]